MVVSESDLQVVKFICRPNLAKSTSGTTKVGRVENVRVKLAFERIEARSIGKRGIRSGLT